MPVMTVGEFGFACFALSLIPLGWLTVQDIRWRRTQRNRWYLEQLQQVSWSLVAHSTESKELIERWIKPMRERLEKGQ